MKLCAIYNTWQGLELLEHSFANIRPLVDAVIWVPSKVSNFGEGSLTDEPNLQYWAETLPLGTPIFIRQIEPDPKKDARTNETDKRNYGLQIAREMGFTHFICCDEDEFYEPEEFLKEKKRFENPKLMGLVCRVKCYFKSPTLTIGYDTTLVPFIHKITPNLRFEFNKNYPFAWTMVDGVPFTHSKKIRIDPTRSMNINDDVEWSEITMHHYSYIRKDLKKKIRNSTARANIERSTLVEDYVNAKEGYFCQFYGKTLEMSPNVFGLPEITDASI